MFVTLYVCKRTHNTGEISSVGQRFNKKKEISISNLGYLQAAWASRFTDLVCPTRKGSSSVAFLIWATPPCRPYGPPLVRQACHMARLFPFQFLSII